MGDGLGRAHVFGRRCRENIANASSSGTDDDDFVSVFRRWYFACQHIVERVYGESALVTRIFVELRRHHSSIVGYDFKFAQLH